MNTTYSHDHKHLGSWAMTCIVGIEHEGKVYLGGDSAGVAGSHITMREDTKVFVNGPMIFGFTSSFRMGQIIQYSLSIPAQPKGQSDFAYLCTTFIEALYTTLELKGYGCLSGGRKQGGQFLLGYKGKLYIIDSDYQVARHKDKHAAVGSGCYFALGSLYTTSASTSLRPEARVAYALDAASHYSTEVSRPYSILSL